jgi:hypothetical protein
MSVERPYTGPERRITRPSPMFIALALLGLAGIIFATLCPIGLRPHFADANQERFGAYFCLGFLFAMVGRRRWLTVTAFVIVVACVLEAGQLLVPGRDARLEDAAFKAMGGVLGSTAGYLSFPLRRLLVRLLGLSKPTVAAPTEPQNS